MKRPEVKMCGITTERDVRLVRKHKADYAGIVMFYEKSKRNVSPATAWRLSALLGDKIKKVAVCVSPTAEQLQMIEHMSFNILQVHGELFEEVLEKSHIPIFRAYNMKDGHFPEPERHDKIIGYVLDGATPGKGKTFDWAEIRHFDTDQKKLILAGGLTAENVGKGIALAVPDVVDVSSYLEKEGVRGKDEDRIRRFMKSVQEAVL